MTASWVQTDALQLWDYRRGALLKNLSFDVADRGDLLTHAGLGGGGAYLYCCQFCTSGVVIAGGTGTNSSQAVSLDNTEVLMELRLGKPVYAVDTAQNGRLVAVAGAGSKMLLSVLS